jgi:hypothetical protein
MRIPEVGDPEKLKDYLRVGAPHTRTFRCVCEKCNNEWMSRIETDAKDVLLALVKGHPVTLLPDGMTVLLNWVTLKAIISENEYVGESVTSDAEIKAFAASRAIPPHYVIFVGTNGGVVRWQSNLVRLSARVAPDMQSLSSGPRNIQSITFGAGAFIVHVVSTVGLRDIRIRPNKMGDDLVRIWPRSRLLKPFSWPVNVRLSEARLDFIAMALKAFLGKIRGLPMSG